MVSALHRPLVVTDTSPGPQATKQELSHQTVQTVYVIGAGLGGVTTAYELGRQGFHVVVFDARPSSGTQCTAACGPTVPLGSDNPLPQIKLSLPECFKGWWYYSDVRRIVLRFKPTYWMRNFGVQVKRKFWMPQDEDPSFERLRDVPSLKTHNPVEKRWMAQRSPQWTLRWKEFIWDPFFWWWSVASVRVWAAKTRDGLRDGSRVEASVVSRWSNKFLQNVLQRESIGTSVVEEGAHFTLFTTTSVRNNAQPDTQQQPAVQQFSHLATSCARLTGTTVAKIEPLWERLSTEDLELKFPTLLRQSRLPFLGARKTTILFLHVEEFVKRLEKICEQKYGVQFAYKTNVTGFQTRKSDLGVTVTGCYTADGDVIPFSPSSAQALSIETEAEWLSACCPVVLATGAWTPRLSASLGVLVPVYPVRHMSVLIPTSKHVNLKSLWGGSADASVVSVTDRVINVVATNTSIRASAFADFGGWGVQIHPRLLHNLINRLTLLQLLPPSTGQHYFAAVVGLQPLVTTRTGYLLGQLPKVTNVFVNVAPTHEGAHFSLGLAAHLAKSLRHRYIKQPTLSDGELDFLFSDSNNGKALEQRHASIRGDALYALEARYSPWFSRLCVWFWERQQKNLGDNSRNSNNTMR